MGTTGEIIAGWEFKFLVVETLYLSFWARRRLDSIESIHLSIKPPGLKL